MTFIKWVGGKTSILNNIIPLITDKITNENINYYESFVGGGSVLIELLKYCEKNNINNFNFYASDLNEKLMNVYNNIKNNCGELLNCIDNFVDNCDFNTSEYYYNLRNKFNKTNSIIKQSSLFIILNKLCFRGIYRENKKGEFNVPYGNYKNPNIYNKSYIVELSKLFNKYNVNFYHESFEKIIPKHNSIIYLDPPYLNMYDSYTSNKFNYEQFDEYIKILIKSSMNIHIILSNSIEYKNNLFKNIINIKINDKINSKSPGKKREEIILYN